MPSFIGYWFMRMERHSWDSTLDDFPAILQDGTLLGSGPQGIFVIYGGAKFHVPNMDIFNTLFPGGQPRELWEGALDGVPTTPVDGTLLREESSTEVFIIAGGHKTLAPTGSMGIVHVLWDGALANVP